MSAYLTGPGSPSMQLTTWNFSRSQKRIVLQRGHRKLVPHVIQGLSRALPAGALGVMSGAGMALCMQRGGGRGPRLCPRASLNCQGSPLHCAPLGSVILTGQHRSRALAREGWGQEPILA